MCCVGDIILIDNYKQDGNGVGRHSFVVISDESGQIQGVDYSIICNVMSSFKSEKQREKKMSYPGNFPINYGDSVMNNGNNKDGYIKTEQLFFFNKATINFKVIGKLNDDVFNALVDFIEQLDVPIQHIYDNL